MPVKRYTKFTTQPGKGAEKLLGDLELDVMRVA
jgi:hypothetical protein